MPNLKRSTQVYFEDLKDLYRNEFKFYKNHAAGTAVMIGVGLGLTIGGCYLLMKYEDYKFRQIEESIEPYPWGCGDE